MRRDFSINRTFLELIYRWERQPRTLSSCPVKRRFLYFAPESSLEFFEAADVIKCLFEVHYFENAEFLDGLLFFTEDKFSVRSIKCVIVLISEGQNLPYLERALSPLARYKLLHCLIIDFKEDFTDKNFNAFSDFVIIRQRNIHKRDEVCESVRYYDL